MCIQLGLPLLAGRLAHPAASPLAPRSQAQPTRCAQLLVGRCLAKAAALMLARPPAPSAVRLLAAPAEAVLVAATALRAGRSASGSTASGGGCYCIKPPPAAVWLPLGPQCFKLWSDLTEICISHALPDILLSRFWNAALRAMGQ